MSARLAELGWLSLRGPAAMNISICARAVAFSLMDVAALITGEKI